MLVLWMFGTTSSASLSHTTADRGFSRQGLKAKSCTWDNVMSPVWKDFFPTYPAKSRLD